MVFISSDHFASTVIQIAVRLRFIVPQSLGQCLAFSVEGSPFLQEPLLRCTDKSLIAERTKLQHSSLWEHHDKLQSIVA